MNTKDIKLIRLAYSFLLQHDGITQDLIKNQFISWKADHNSLNDVFERILEYAQNRDSSVNVIGKSIGGIKNLKPVLFNFNPHKTLNKFPVGSERLLREEIIDKLQPLGQLRDTPKSKWTQYVKTIISGAKFLSNFKDHDKFKNFIGKYDSDSISRSGLALIISTEIFGFGFPLACDFLKELGYRGFSKADVHTKDILLKLGYISYYTNGNLDYYAFQAMHRISESNDIEPFMVDKLLWLIGSGVFYLPSGEEFKIGRNREKFIAYAKANGL
ncbi:MAG: hypothetical protein MH321_11460 [Leptospiraceae bacterium]|nr:hypothetical protein [Leptospiraceae bacterium]